jgi:two-component system cell cycle sensor histidine kinase/response regulator CckA
MSEATLRYWVRTALLAAAYAGAGWLSLRPAVAQGIVSTVWAPSGIGVAALLLFGWRAWPAVMLGSFAVGLSTDLPVAAAVVIALGSTAMAVAGTVVARRMFDIHPAMDRARDPMLLSFVCGLAAAVISASLGIATLDAIGVIGAADRATLWRSWWMGDTLGVVLVAPVILTMALQARERWTRVRLLEAVTLSAAVVVGTWSVFVAAARMSTPVPVAFAVFPLVIWAAVRFGPRGASLASLVISMLAMYGATRGVGPFASRTLAEAVLQLLPYLFVMAITALVLAAIVVERERALRSLRESEERLAGILTSLDDVVWSTSAVDDRLLYVSEAVERVYGRTRAEVGSLPRWWIDASHPDDRVRVEEYAVALRRTGKEELEYRIVRPDGVVRWVFDRGALVRDAAGQPQRYDGIVTDITERKRAEEELQRQRQQLLLLFQQTPLGVIEWDPQLRVTGWNPSAERIFGYSAGQALGHTAGELLSGVGALDTPVDDAWRDILQSKGSARRTRHHRTRRGDFITCEWYDTTLVDAHGTMVGAASLVEDISERVTLEEQLRQAQKMEAVGKLAGGVAHDFNNLLTAISGYGALVLRGMSDMDSARDDVQAILTAADRAAALTRQLLAFSRKQVLAPRVLDLNAALASTEMMLRRLIGEHIELVTVPGVRTLRVQADPSQLEQVIMNLALNARDAMPEGGRLTIATDDVEIGPRDARRRAIGAGRYVRLTVRDTGHGMDRATRARIFEPFFTTKAQGRGTGLGLSTVYGIVKQSGGTIDVESELGLGATFRILLPAVSAVADPIPTQPLAPASAPASGRVLLVEDEEALRRLVEKTLASQGYRVLTAPDGLAALDVASADGGAIDLLLTDVVMPRMGGKQLAQRLTQLRPDVRVLFMSGYTEDVFVRQSIVEAGVAFLPKPFTAEELTRAVGDAMAKPAQPQIAQVR